MQERILVVDDEENIRQICQVGLESAGYEVATANNGTDAWIAFKSSKYPFSLVVTDLSMPGIDGVALLEKIKSAYPQTDVIIITGAPTIESAIKTLKQGAYDYIIKPFDIDTLKIVINRCLESKRLAEELNQEKKLRKELESAYQKLQLATEKNVVLQKELEESSLDTIYRLSAVSEFRDQTTGTHIQRISESATGLAKIMKLSDTEVKMIRYAAPMHDIGKIAIPDSILLKPGKLTEEEFEVIKTHTIIGARILSDSNHELLQLSEKIALSHHEKFDGSGYPDGLKGDQIPLPARIVAVTDVFDALTSNRPYKPAFSEEYSIKIIQRDAGTHFDPELASLFVDNFDKIVKNKFSNHGLTPD